MYNTTFYETELQVRPDDIDMFQHVHSAKYIDYVLAARFDQMDRCYGNPMSDYLHKGLGWVVNKCEIQFKRPLQLGDRMVVKTALKEVLPNGVIVQFEILRKETGKLCCDGYFLYTLIDLKTSRAQALPEWALERYR